MMRSITYGYHTMSSAIIDTYTLTLYKPYEVIDTTEVP
jgi:hypothetical protein